MRNLKKILALVLALVMSLSLMATASAADFADVKDDTNYKTAIEVLSGLGVFNGYKEDGTFRPDGEITRAETAAIIYRIVTGDVKDEQVAIYRDYGLFSDVPDTAWYAGYVNFCANAQYIKGDGKGHFNPNDKVEGYAALAMILRAIGYTANGGFTGSDWRTQTARVGEARKITKNITSGTLGTNADRKTVAEILFQAILVDMVDHNVDNTFNGEQGYTTLPGQTLGKKTFGLEEVVGVVVGNEYADLNSAQVLANNRTDLKVGDEIWKLNYGTEITDIGEARLVYTTNRSGVVAMYDSKDGAALNKVTEYGKACDVSTTAKFNAAAEMPAASDIEYYVNFANNVSHDCDYRLEFQVTFQTMTAENSFNRYIGNTVRRIAVEEGWDIKEPESTTPGDPDGVAGKDDVGGATVGGYPVTYHYIVRAHDLITNDDLDVIRGIFGAADNAPGLGDNNVIHEIDGDVFLGTKSSNQTSVIIGPDGTKYTVTTTGDQDISNQISYTTFYDEYINDDENVRNWGVSLNGQWVKFVDNDGDGAAEYAFLTGSWLDEALYTYTNRNGDTVTEFNAFDDNTYDQVDTNRYTVRYLNDYTPAVGDKVIASRIDNQILVEPAKNETVTVSAYSWRNDEITTDKGPYGQSGIGNETDMLELISTMDDKVEYIVYLDHFGYVRAYEIPGGTTYALVTEMYYTNGNQGNLVKDWPMTAELTTLNDEGKTVTDEYSVVSGAGTFTAKQPWLRVNNAVATYNYNNWLQPAIAHLGVTRNGYAPNPGTPSFAVPDGNSGDYIGTGAAYSCFWPANSQLVRNINVNGMNGLEEFNYGAQTFDALYKNPDKSDYNWRVNASASFTNVAIVNINDKSAQMSGAAKLALNNDGTVVAPVGNRNAYAYDYIQLSTADIAKAAVRYPIGGSGAYVAENNNYVNAVHDTQYFIAYNGGVYAFKDYANFPGLSKKDNQIHAAYAVAKNTNSDVNGVPYWVADVIVFEVYDLNDTAQTSVSLAYYTPTRTSGNVQEINTLNSKYGKVALIPGERAWNADRGQWGAEWEGYGFYALYNDTEAVDNVMSARDIDRIGAKKNDGTFEMNYGKNKIHAGIIIREAYIEGAGEYIDVDMSTAQDGSKIASIEITNKIYSVTNKDAYSDGRYLYTEADLLRYENTSNSQVRKGDAVIWVGDAATNGTRSGTNFVVDLGSFTSWNRLYAGFEILEDTPSWLISYYWDSAEQTYKWTAPSATSSTEWQKIMWEQNNTPTDYDYSVIVKFVDAAGNPIAGLADIKVGDVNKNGSLLIKTSDITLPGWTLGTVTNKTTNTVIASSTVAGTAGYLITGIDKNTVVEAVQTKTEQTISLTSVNGTIALKKNDAVVAPAPTTGTTTSVVIGDKFEYTVSGLDNVTNQYALTSTPIAFAEDVEVTWNAANNTATIKGTVPAGNVTLTLTASVRATTTINVAAGSSPVTFTVNTPAGAVLTSGDSVYQGTDVTFTVNALAANTAIDKVTYTVGAGAPQNAEVVDAATLKYKVPGTAVAAMPITINVTTTSTAPSTVTFTNNATGDVFMTQAAAPTAGDWEELPANIEVPHDYSGTISIQSMAPITVTAGSAAATVSASTDYKHYTISNITGNVTITLADAGTASGLSATVAADGKVSFSGVTTGNKLQVYVTTGTTAPTLSVGVGMTVAEAEDAISTDTSESAGLTPVTDPANFTLTSAANTHYLVIVETNTSGYVTKAGTVEVTGIT